MIVDTVMTESTKIPDYDMMIEYPLNPARRALWRMEDEATKNNRKIIEYSTWHDCESSSEVVAVKSTGLECW